MSNIEYLDYYLEKTDALRESTVQQLLNEHPVYQAVSQEEEAAEIAYMALDLTKEQREVVEEYLRQKETSYIIYADYSYLAGMKNAMALQAALDITETV